MSNYLYFQNEEQTLTNRYSTQEPIGDGYPINGYEIWRNLISRLLEYLSKERNEEKRILRTQTVNELNELNESSDFPRLEMEILMSDRRSTEELIATLLILKLRKSYNPLPKNICPRLFISHRRIDKNYALRVAELAIKNNFAFWLDVLNPDLHALQNSTIPKKLIPLVTACIIEMALINCTHVIALMTVDTKGTMWVPYEYGRLRELPGLSINACAWLHPNFDSSYYPEYMLLGGIAKTEKEIIHWLQTERNFHDYRRCNPIIKDFSVFGGTEKLPEEIDEKLRVERWRMIMKEAIDNVHILKRDIPRKRVHLKRPPHQK